ncbi:MAG TPA: butyrate kinase, partial [Firmicutes bacterium]|nr:butyrate kinase [Bacillota bacterium]
NPGSTSTKIALFQGEELVFAETLHHSSKELGTCKRVIDQFPLRRRALETFLQEKKIDLESLAAVVGRGGVLTPVVGGTYTVNREMITELREAPRGEHASNLGALLANEIAAAVGIPAYIVDPVVVDELEPLARVTGMAGIKRRSIFHALNQKAVARRAAKELGRSYTEVNLVVAHLGGGISVGVHSNGRVIDVNNALDGDGPFSPERSGGVPAGDLIRLCFSGKLTEREIYRNIVGGGGLVGYLGTNDAREIEERINKGEEEAQFYYEAMAYQIAKEIGAASTVLMGQLDAIVLTGGLAHSNLLTGWIRERVNFLAPVLIYPGERELEALAQGALRVLRGEEKAKLYSPGGKGKNVGRARI